MLPLAIGEVGQPAFHSWRQGFNAPVVVEDDQSRGLRPVGVGGLADEQPTPGYFTHGGRHLPQETQLFGGEQRSIRFAVEPEHAPGLPRSRP